MGRVLRFVAPGEVDVVDEPDPPLAAGQVRVDTLFSGISAGTELSAYRGTNPYLTRRWDAEAHLFLDADAAGPAYPLVGWGYSEVGVVVEAAPDVTAVAVGDTVWGIWGHRSRAVLPQEALAGHVVPDEVDPRAATFVRVASVALNGVLNTQLGIGSVVGVVGLGVIGLLATRFAVLSGATVVAVDPIAARRDRAAAWGAAHTFAPGVGLAADVRDLTQGRGADVVLELSGSARALHEAVRLAGPEGVVVASGFYQGDAEGLRLGEEFHHNRVRLQSSQIGAVPPQLAARWTRDRLIFAAAQRVLAGDPNAAALVSHTFGLDEAPAAYDLVDRRGHEALQVLFDFTGS